MLTRVVAKQAKTTKVKNKFVNGKKSLKEYSVQAKSSNLPCRFCSNSDVTPLEFAAFRSGFDAKYSRVSAFWFLLSTTMVFTAFRTPFARQNTSIFMLIGSLSRRKRSSGLISSFIRRRPGFGSQRGSENFFFWFIFFYLTTWMRVFSQIYNCQQKTKTKTNKQTNKTKTGAPLLGLAKSIYIYVLSPWLIKSLRNDQKSWKLRVEYPHISFSDILYPQL